MSSLFLLILRGSPESIKTVRRPMLTPHPYPPSLRLLEKNSPDIKDRVSVVDNNKKKPATDKAWSSYGT
jgi:hypothetical protein